jgi:hypothetical protein
MTSNGRRAQRLARGTFAVVIGFPPLFGFSGAARAETFEVTYSYSGTATADGIGFVYDQVGLLALSPILDTGFPRAAASIENTPSSAARAAPAEPGLVGALNGIGPVLGIPPGVIPPYPLYADASYPSGPFTAHVGADVHNFQTGVGLAGLLSGSSVARQDDARASAQFGRGTSGPVSVPASGAAGLGGLTRLVQKLLGGAASEDPIAAEKDSLFSVTTGEATVAVKRTGHALTESAISRLTGVSLLGGLITIGQAESTMSLDIPEPGRTPKIQSRTDVTDIRLLGLPIRVTDKGLEFVGNSVPLPVATAINDLIASRGGSFRIAQHRSASDTAAVSALVFDFDGVLVAGIPGLPPIPFVTNEHQQVHLAMGAISLGFSSSADRLPVPDSIPPSSDQTSSSPSSGGQPPSGSGLSATIPDVPTSTPAGVDLSKSTAAPGPAIAPEPPTSPSAPGRRGFGLEVLGLQSPIRLTWIAGLLLPASAAWLAALAAARFRMLRTRPQS